MSTGKVDVLLGLQWGDEGKGKVVDVLTPHYDVIASRVGPMPVIHSNSMVRSMFYAVFPPASFKAEKSILSVTA